MPITLNSIQLTKEGWAVNAITQNCATSAYVIKTAPGAGKNLTLKEIHICAGTSALTFVGTRASGTAAVTRVLGAMSLTSGHTQYQDKFLQGLRLPTNEALIIGTSAAAGGRPIQVYASGDVLGD